MNTIVKVPTSLTNVKREKIPIIDIKNKTRDITTDPLVIKRNTMNNLILINLMAWKHVTIPHKTQTSKTQARCKSPE